LHLTVYFDQLRDNTNLLRNTLYPTDNHYFNFWTIHLSLIDDLNCLTVFSVSCVSAY